MTRTVFVIGAGSSIAIGGSAFPGGPSLLASIGAELRDPGPHHGRSATGQLLLSACARMLGPNGTNRFVNAANKIAKLSLAHNSIDQLITNASDNDVSLVAKTSIAYFVGHAEASQTTLGGASAGRDARKFWISAYLREYISRAKTIDDARKLLSNLAFIVFNYDRLIEQLLFIFLRDRFPVSDAAVLDLISNIRIEHPYGLLSPLGTHWSDGRLPVGFKDFDRYFYELAPTMIEGLRTFGESLDKDIPDRIQTTIRGCENVVFVGFGFGDENLELIAPTENGDSPRKRFFATNYGINPRRWSNLERALLRRFSASSDPNHQSVLKRVYQPGRVHTVGDCSDLVDHFSLEW